MKTHRMTLLASAAAMALAAMPALAQTTSDGGDAGTGIVPQASMQAGATGAVAAKPTSPSAMPSAADQAAADEEGDDAATAILPVSPQTAKAGAPVQAMPGVDGNGAPARQVATDQAAKPNPHMAERAAREMRNLATALYEQGFREGYDAALTRARAEQSAQATPQPDPVRYVRRADGSTLLLLPAGMTPQDFAQQVDGGTVTN